MLPTVCTENHFDRRFHIGDKEIGQDCPVYIIAEAGVNHNGSLQLAFELIDAAFDAGADAVKFQTFKAESLNTATAPKAQYHIETTGSDNDQSWLELLKSQQLSKDHHERLMAHAYKRGIQFLSTPYDSESLALLDALAVPAIKIASTDLNNHPFIIQVASLHRPILLSTAMSEMAEVDRSVTLLEQHGCRELVVMHCTGAYPTKIEETHMRAMVTMGETFGTLTGYSDHTQEDINPILAVALGAVVVEKHLTLDHTLPGPDQRMSLNPDDFARTVTRIRQAESALGRSKKRVLACERETRQRLRKSVVAAVPIPAGCRLRRGQLTLKRPGSGISPSALSDILGRVTVRKIECDQLVTWEDLI